MLVGIPAKDRPPAREGDFLRFEDRIVVVRAADEHEAQNRGEAFAADYEQTSSWKVLKIVDVQEILDAQLGDGVEIYSAFIGRDGLTY
jgi:uncharacterized protein DUF4288